MKEVIDINTVKDLIDELGETEMDVRNYANQLDEVSLSNLLVTYKVVKDYIAFSKFLNKESLVNIFVTFVLQEKHNRIIYRGK